VPDGGREPADYSGEEDEEADEKSPVKGPLKGDVGDKKSNGSPVKRARDEEPSGGREGKRTKKV